MKTNIDNILRLYYVRNLKYYIVSTFIILFLFNKSKSLCYSQISLTNCENYPQYIWLTPLLISNETIPIRDLNGNLLFGNIELNDFFHRHNIIDFEIAFPSLSNYNVKNKYGLDSVYQISCNCDLNILADSINYLFSSLYKKIELSPIYELLYTPNDFSILDNLHGENWQLKMIKAEETWDITKGSAAIIIAIKEPGWGHFDLNHEDLQNNILYSKYTNPPNDEHGTFVAGCASAVSNNSIGISSIGFNTKLMLYSGHGGPDDWIDAVIRGARIINVSYMMGCWFNSNVDNIANMLSENGIIIVAGAGNGTWPLDHPTHPGMVRGSCGLTEYVYPASYDNVISVSSVGDDNKHWDYTDGSGSTHTHNDKVDICAPGYRVLSLYTNNNYGRSSGTSFATPITAGVIALMLSVNPCLNISSVRNIFYQTSDNIDDENQYPNMLGAGRVNAYEAVKMAGTRNIDDETFSGTTTYQAGYAFNIENTSVAANSDITLRARWEVNMLSSFDVPLGSSFEVIIDPTAVNDCE